MISCVLFDFDGTLTRRDTTRLYLRSFARVRPLRTLFALPHIVAILKAGPEPAAIQSAKFRLLGALRKGLSARALREIHRLYAEQANRILRPDVLNAMRSHSLAGHCVLVVTASARDAVEAVFENEQVTVMGTEFAADAGRETGELDGLACYGENKRILLKQWAAQKGGGIDFIEAWSDSIEDIPMMSMATRRCWVCPPADPDQVAQFDADPVIIDGSQTAP